MRIVTALLVMALVAQVSAGGIARADQTWLCSVVAATAVDEDGTVGPPELGDRERPTFLRVDVAKKELTLLAPLSRKGEVTKLQTAYEKDGVHILSGVENDRSVSLLITPDGRMTLSVVADGVVWSVFGHAIPEADLQAPAEAKEGQ